MTCKKAKRTLAEKYPESVEIPRDRTRPFHSGYTEVTFFADADLMEILEDVQDLLASAQPGMQMREVIRHLAVNYHDRHYPVAKAKRAKEREVKRAAAMQQSPSMTRAEESEVSQMAHGDQPDTIVPVRKRTYSQAMVHELIHRDGYCCSFVDPITGKKCQTSRRLEIHHVRSWSSGGETSLDNATWLCSSRHARISFLEFGDPARFQVNRKHALKEANDSAEK